MVAKKETKPKKKIETETVDNKSVKKKEIIPETAEKKAVQPKKAIPEMVDNKSDQQMKSKPKTIDERIAQLVEQRKKQQSEQSKTKTEEKTQEKDNQIEGLEEMFVQDEPVQEKILSEIRIQKRTNSIDISILFQPYTQHQVFEIIDPPPKRIVIDIYNISEIKSGRSIRVNDFGIVSIRTGMYKINIARVVFDAEGDLPPYRIEMTEGGLKLVIEKVSNL